MRGIRRPTYCRKVKFSHLMKVMVAHPEEVRHPKGVTHPKEATIRRPGLNGIGDDDSFQFWKAEVLARIMHEPIKQKP